MFVYWLSFVKKHLKLVFLRFCMSSAKSDLNKFGTGVSLYFKFLKYMICWFGIFFIFSIPILIINLGGSIILIYLLYFIATQLNYTVKIDSF